MQLQKLMMLIIATSILSSCTTPIKPQSPVTETTLNYYNIENKAAPTCDEVLESCMETARKQQEALRANEAVIKQQDAIIVTKDEQIKNSQGETSLWKTVSVILGTLAAVLLLK